jgi:hypothetical protein
VSQFATESLLSLALLFGTFRPQCQSHICTIFEEVLVARAEGIGAIAFRSSTPIRDKLALAAVPFRRSLTLEQTMGE